MTELLPELARPWWQWTVAMSVQVAWLALVVGVLDATLLRRSWPQLRMALWLLVLAKLVLPPTLSSPVSVAHLGVPTGNEVRGASIAPSLLLAAFGVWVAGVAIVAAWTSTRYVGLRRALLASAEPVRSAGLSERMQRLARRMGMRKLPHIRVVANLRAPAVLGFFRPIVLVPAELLEGPPERLDHALLHELAHVARRDPLANLAGLVLQAIYWFHPAVWMVRRRLAILREIRCDHAAASALEGSPDAYRRTLLSFAAELATLGRTLGPRAHGGSLGLFCRRSELIVRLLCLERFRADRPLLRRMATLALGAAILATCVPLAERASRRVGAWVDPWPNVEIPPLEELPGCLQLRYAVRYLSAREAARSSPDTEGKNPR